MYIEVLRFIPGFYDLFLPVFQNCVVQRFPKLRRNCVVQRFPKLRGSAFSKIGGPVSPLGGPLSPLDGPLTFLAGKRRCHADD